MRFGFPLLMVAAPFLLSASNVTSRPAEPMTAAGVLAASDDWIAAERLGHVAEVDVRLADDYRDVESDGRVHVKAELLTHTATRKDIWPGTAADVAQAFHKKYPSVDKVVIEGSTAILSYHSKDPKLGPYMIAEDTFAYERGMWKGVLSTHFHVPTAGSP